MEVKIYTYVIYIKLTASNVYLYVLLLLFFNIQAHINSLFVKINKYINKAKNWIIETRNKQ